MSTTFQKKTEDFECTKCGFSVKGCGYTNHCPKCLYSKHVDIHPGDRLESCEGLMEPIFLEKEKGEEKLTHSCLACGHTRKNKVSAEDSFEALLSVSKKMVEKS